LPKQVVFDENYYQSIMKEYGYDPLKFERFDFSLGGLRQDDLQRRWLCHHGCGVFAEGFKKGEKSIVSTGVGLSGTPHVGTLSQILRSVVLQKAGIPVQMVLGDLDAYNGKGIPLRRTLELAEQYREFILNLGFDSKSPSILRSQFDETGVLRTSYLIGHYMDDDMFDRSEEDLHDFYAERGKVDSKMSYRRKLSLNLMTADFIHLHTQDSFKHVLVMLGIDEHKYVQFARETVRRMSRDPHLTRFDMTLGGMYSPIIRGFYGYSKMSKSFPQSSITVDMDPNEVRKRIMEGEGHYDKPENSVVYQMMAAVSTYSPQELEKCYIACLDGGKIWGNIKSSYVDMLVDILSKWSR